MGRKTEFYLFCQKLEDVQYNPHYLALNVDPFSLGEFTVLRFEELLGPPVNIVRTASGANAIRIKEYYLSQ